jgi:cyanophycin synthetase
MISVDGEPMFDQTVTEPQPARAQRDIRAALGVADDALPLVAIGGSRGKSTVAWMLDAILRDAGHVVGSWLSSGVYINSARLQGEMGPWAEVVRDARSGALDLVLQEMDAATVVAAGLPQHSYPLAIVTTLCGNNEACQLAPETRLERRALTALLDAVRDDGAIVANADDLDVIEAVERRGGRMLCFALHHDNPALQRQLGRGGVAVWVDDGTIVHGSADGATVIMNAHDVPATLDGAMLFQEQNALAAAAAALALGVPLTAIRSGLSRYTPDPVLQPAACNVLRYNGGTIVVDAPGNIWSLRMVTRGIRHQPRRRTMVVSGGFPLMRGEDVREAGRILGNLGAIVLVHGELADPARIAALKDGMAATALPPVVITMSDEVSAIEHLLNALGADDVGLVLADDPERALARLWPAPAISIHRPRRKPPAETSVP